MIAHTGIAVKNYKKGRVFYEKTLAPLGYKLNLESSVAAGFMEGGETSFWIVVREHPQPSHVAFGAKDKRVVEAFHRAALRAGGKDNGKPGYRSDYWPGYYAAFILDADGNNIEAVWYDYSKVEPAKKATQKMAGKATAKKKVMKKK